jgi:glycosyltransferase involved in cell wall biosynthesis
MKFLFVTLGYHPHPPGGAWRVAADLAETLAGRGHGVEVVTANTEGRLPAGETLRGVRVRRFAERRGHFALNWLAAARAARGLAARAVAAAGGPVLTVLHHAYVGRAATGAGAPLLAILHGPWAEEFLSQRAAPPRPAVQRALDALVAGRLRAEERRGLRRARRILVLSRHFASLLPRWHPGPLPPAEIVGGGVDLGRFAPAADRAAVRAEFGLAPEERLFLAVRRLDPRMGLGLLVEGFARVAAARPAARLWLAGRGPEEAALRAKLAAAGLGERARLLGFVPEERLPALYQAADFTVMPSLELEGFGLATAESLACGTPVLGSRAAATPELLEPLAPGLLFAPGSADALAAKLHEALAEPGRFPDRARCRAYAAGRFTWDAMAGACERAWRDFAGNGGQR